MLLIITPDNILAMHTPRHMVPFPALEKKLTLTVERVCNCFYRDFQSQLSKNYVGIQIGGHHFMMAIPGPKRIK